MRVEVGVAGEQPITGETVLQGFETEVLTRSRRRWEDLIQSYGRAGAHSDAVCRVELGLMTHCSPALSICFPRGLIEEVTRRLKVLEDRRSKPLVG